MKKINLIAASRERPDRMADVLKKWIENSEHPELLRVIISIDSDDYTWGRYYEVLGKITEGCKIDLLIIKNDNKCTVEAINSAKPYIDGELIIIFSDDTDCFNRWDTELSEFSKDLFGKYIIKTSDGIGTDLITMPIFSKEYIDNFGYIYHPSYSHMFCDTELTCVAHLLGNVIDGSKFVFNHLHYTKKYHPKDRIDVKNQKTFYTGMENFKNRMRINFDLNTSDIKGEIPGEIIEWIENN